MTEKSTSKGRIVVGVDGSEAADVALSWAVSEAALRDATLHVIHAWQYPAVGELAGLATSGVGWDDLEGPEREWLDRRVAELTAARPDLHVDKTLAYGAPASVLLLAAKGADLLVVGSRGRGGFAGLLLGSVSQQCAHHAPCPVVIIPAE